MKTITGKLRSRCHRLAVRNHELAKDLQAALAEKRDLVREVAILKRQFAECSAERKGLKTRLLEVMSSRANAG